MTGSRSGETLLAEADLKADKLGSHLGVVFVEGEDDRRCLAGRFVPHEQIVVADGKPHLLDAYRIYKRSGETRYVFVADCDYDVPAGSLRPQPDLIVTKNPSLETDLVEAGVLSQIAEEFVPRGKWHDGLVESTTCYLLDRSVALAEGLGKLRYISREQKLGLRFTGLRRRLNKYRNGGVADIGRMINVLLQQKRPNLPTAHQLRRAADDLGGGLKICDGHDLLVAVSVVLHEDFGLNAADTNGVPAVLRTAVDLSTFSRTEVGLRLLSWELMTRQKVLR